MFLFRRELGGHVINLSAGLNFSGFLDLGIWVLIDEYGSSLHACAIAVSNMYVLADILIVNLLALAGRPIESI